MEGTKIKKEPLDVKEDPDSIDLKNKLEIRDDDTEEDGSDDGDDVFEVERVVGHMRDSVLGLRYQLKWKGYSDNENTYEPEASVFCHGLVNEYWERYLAAGGKKSDQEGHDPKPQPVKRKAAAQQGLMPDLDLVLNKSPSKATTKNVNLESRSTSNDSSMSKTTNKGIGQRREDGKDTAPSKRQKISNSSDNEPTTWSPPASWESWESHINRVEAVEQRRSENGTEKESLIIHILWLDGKQTEVSSKVAHKKCPVKLLEFYESHLLFQEEEDSNT
ncbi:hypothetical protein BGX20_000985 [Mortierella sp. AD010]|nr:hypothetical protein BGX20_000985 [Mortierella sp. AD010]